jgi:hypothetical protein
MPCDISLINTIARGPLIRDGADVRGVAAAHAAARRLARGGRGHRPNDTGFVGAWARSSWASTSSPARWRRGCSPTCAPGLGRRASPRAAAPGYGVIAAA